MYQFEGRKRYYLEFPSLSASQRYEMITRSDRLKGRVNNVVYIYDRGSIYRR